MDGIKESLDRISDLNEAELADLEGQIINEFESLEKQGDHTAASVDAMTALADALDSVRGEQTSRAELAAQLEQRAAEAATRVHGGEAANTKNPDEQDPNEQDPTADAAGDAVPDAGADPSAPPADPAAPTDPNNPVTDPNDPTEEETPAEDAAPDEEDDSKKKVPTTFANESGEGDSGQPAEGQPAEQPTMTPETEPAPEGTPSEAPAEPAAPETPAEPATPDTGGGDTTPTNVPDAPSNAVVPDAAVPAMSDVAPSTAPSAQHEELPVAASAQTTTDVVVTPPADARPVARQRAGVAITAGADIPGMSAGTVLASAKQVAEAFTKRLHNLQRVSSPNGQQYTVATLTADYPEERTLHAGDLDGNWDKIEKVISPQVVTAAGACVPLEIRYDIFGTGVTDTPVADSLPKFSADRGGIQFTPGPLLPTAPYDAAMGVWQTDGSVADIDGGVLADGKPCYQVECLPPVTAEVEAVSMCLCFDNLTTRVYPELIARHNELALIQWARISEQRLLSKIRAGATTTITATGVLGAAREILGQVDKVAAGLRYRNRLAPNQPLRAIFPYWLKDMVRTDVSYQMPGDGFEDTLQLADAALNSWFRARNINVTWSMEARYGSTAVPAVANIASNVAGYPATIEWDLFAEGTFLVLDGGTLDLGVIRDSTHVANNTYCEFAESWSNVVKIGGDSIHVTSTLSVNGQAAALVDTTP